MTSDLFADDTPLLGTAHALGDQAMVLRGLAVTMVEQLWPAVQDIAHQAPFRHMLTPGGQRMSVPLTNCGQLGWTSSRAGYRYSSHDPVNNRPWPALPEVFLQLAAAAAAAAGFQHFVPDACLINCYTPGTRLSLHQDRNESDFSQPIVSVSLGIPAMFLWGGLRRSDRTQRVPLFHGDVAVWGGVDRLRFHGVATIERAEHPLTGSQRINLTLRKAGGPTRIPCLIPDT